MLLVLNDSFNSQDYGNSNVLMNMVIGAKANMKFDLIKLANVIQIFHQTI